MKREIFKNRICAFTALVLCALLATGIMSEVKPAAAADGSSYVFGSYIYDDYGAVIESPAAFILERVIDSNSIPSASLNFASCDDVCTASDGRIFLTDKVNSRINVFDSNGNFIKSLKTIWTKDGSMYYINYDSTIHCCDKYRIYDYTDYFFVNPPTSKILSAEYNNDCLFCNFNEKNYITYYSSEPKPGITEINHEHTDVYGSEGVGVEIFENAPDMDYRLITESFYSEDRKYYFAHYADHTAKIYDAATFKELYSFDGKNGHFVNLIYSELTHSYILSGKYESFILNGKMEVVSKTDRIIDEADGKLIMMTIKKQCYEVPFVSYEDLIKRTDTYLQGYEPSDAVRQKYKLK